MVPDASQSRPPVPLWIRLPRVLAAVLMYTYFHVGAAIYSWIILPWANFRLRKATAAERYQHCQDRVGRTFIFFMDCVRWLRIVDFDPRKRRLNAPEGPFVLVANHPTLIDVTALLAVHHRMCCIAKPSMFRSFSFGRLLRYCGHIEAGRTPMAGAATVAACLERLEMGMPVLIFPEGTRSPPASLGSLHRGAFEIAARAKAPILPVILTCTPPMLTRDMAWYALPKVTGHYEMKPLPTTSMDTWEGNSRAAAAHFQGIFADAVRECHGVDQVNLLAS